MQKVINEFQLFSSDSKDPSPSRWPRSRYLLVLFLVRICRLAFLMYLKIGAEGECGEVQDDGEGGGDLCGDVW